MKFVFKNISLSAYELESGRSLGRLKVSSENGEAYARGHWNPRCFRPQAENHDGWLKDSNLIQFEISDPHRVQNAKWCFMVEIFCGFLFQEKNKIKVLYPLTAPKMDLPWNMLGYTVECWVMFAFYPHDKIMRSVLKIHLT